MFRPYPTPADHTRHHDTKKKVTDARQVAMDALEIPLLSEGAPDDSAVMPALRKLLLLASSQDADKQAQVRELRALNCSKSRGFNRFTLQPLPSASTMLSGFHAFEQSVS